MRLRSWSTDWRRPGEAERCSPTGRTGRRGPPAPSASWLCRTWCTDGGPVAGRRRRGPVARHRAQEPGHAVPPVATVGRPPRLSGVTGSRHREVAGCPLESLPRLRGCPARRGMRPPKRCLHWSRPRSVAVRDLLSTMRPLFAIAPLALMLAAVGPLQKPASSVAAKSPGAEAERAASVSPSTPVHDAAARHPHGVIRQARITQAEANAALRRP